MGTKTYRKAATEVCYIFATYRIYFQKNFLYTGNQYIIGIEENC